MLVPFSLFLCISFLYYGVCTMSSIIGPEPVSQKDRETCRKQIRQFCRQQGITFEECFEMYLNGELKWSNNKKKQLRKMIAETMDEE